MSLIPLGKKVYARDEDGNEAIRVIVKGQPILVDFKEQGDYLNQYSESNSVAGLATVTVINYTVPVGKEFKLQSISFDGENRGIYIVDLNGSTEAKRQTYFTKYDGEFNFANYVLSAGDIIKLIVENVGNSTADFNANMQGRLLDV